MGLMQRFFKQWTRKAHPLEQYLAQSGFISASGQTVTTQSALQQIAVFNCIRVLSESVGMMPCKFYERKGRYRNPAQHALTRVLEVAPNDYMTAQEFWELLTVTLCLRGNFYAYKVKALGQVTELLPINPDIVTPVLGDDWQVAYKVRFKSGERLLTQEELWHVRIFSTDGLNGVTPIACARQMLGLNQALEQHAATFFKNGAVIGGIVKVPSTLTPDARDKLQADIIKGMSGSDNAHKAVILEHGMDWQPVGLNMQDSQFIESRKMTEAQICGMFRVPPHLVANMEKMTLNNIEHLGMAFVNFTLVPYLTRIEHRITVGLLDKSEQAKYYAKFNTAALLRGDLKARTEAYAKGINWGIYSPNDCRELEELNPRDGGDIYLKPMNMSDSRKRPADDTDDDATDQTAA